jgi:DNA-binding PadR family transcriptional regulator
MNNELMILGLLKNHPMHGYQVMDRVKKVMSVCASLKRPTVYFLLDKMEKNGWVDSTKIKDGKRPTRKVYEITPQGKDAYYILLREALKTPSKIDFQGDYAIGFIDDLPRAESIELLIERKRMLEIELDKIRATPLHNGKPKWVVEHREKFTEWEIQWIDQIILRIQQNRE